MFDKFLTVFKIPELRRKIWLTLALLCVYRLGYYITLPNIDQSQIKRNMEQMQTSNNPLGQTFQLVQLFSASEFGSATIFGLGIMPYISASIILQLLASVWPPLEKLQKEGDRCRDIRHDPEAENRRTAKFGRREQLHQLERLPQRVVAGLHLFHVALDLGLVDIRQGDVVPQPIDAQQRQCQPDLPTEFGNLEDCQELVEHRLSIQSGKIKAAGTSSSLLSGSPRDRSRQALPTQALPTEAPLGRLRPGWRARPAPGFPRT